jgi:4-hydroxy-3-polyprenylbenzoate decarboxylase
MNDRAPNVSGAGTGGPRAVMVGLCGGSGAAYGLRLVAALLDAEVRVHVAATKAALRVLRYEVGIVLDELAPDLASLWPTAAPGRLHVHDLAAVEAAPSSGSAGVDAVVLCPCSMGTLARVAHGFSSNLIERAADAAIKEGRTLVVVPRETPLSVVHLRNLLTLAEAGAVVLPAMPGFYHRPKTVDDLVEFVVGKILDRLRVPSDRIRRWRTPEPTRPATDTTSIYDEGEGLDTPPPLPPADER